MRVVFFGTYELDRVPRVQVLMEGFAALGDEVTECRASLGLTHDQRVRILHRPRLLPHFALRLAGAWWRLWRQSRRLPPPDVVVVGYMAHFDVHLARACFPRATLVLDHLVSAEETALDRRAPSATVPRALRVIDRAAVSRADIVCVDTDEHRDALPASRDGALVVPVGAPAAWYQRGPAVADGGTRRASPPAVVFFGMFTPLHGTPVIARALVRLAERGVPARVTLVGTGQDYAEVRAMLDGFANVRWVNWLPPAQLAPLVADHAVCLGIFGTSPKAHRVVPQKLYQGAAAGCALVTSDTPPQRRAFGNAAVLVPPGDDLSLADVLTSLLCDSAATAELQRAALERAQDFRPPLVVGSLRSRLVSSELAPT